MSIGFFTNTELAKIAKVEIDPDRLESDCLSCGLYKNKELYHPKLEVDGGGKKKILIVGEFPNFDEDKHGSLFYNNGDMFKNELKKNGVNFYSDCWRVAAVRCSIPFSRKNNQPSKKEIKYCFPYVEKIIHELKPELIIVCGNASISAFFGDVKSKAEAQRWTNFCIHDEKYKTKIVCIHDPRFVEYKKFDKNLHAYFAREIKFAVKQLNKPFRERKDYEGMVKILTNFEAVTKVLKFVIRKRIKIAYDYETTGIKPFRKGHKIVSIGFAISPTKGYAFPYNYKTFWTENEFAEIERLWQKIVSNNKILKIAHNLKFETVWTEVLVKEKLKGKHWCTMLTQHVLDHRTGTTALKLQTFLRYGVRPYDEHISKFLEAKNGEFNEVEKAPLKELLLYNGLDCIFTYMLYEDQMSYLSKMRKMNNANWFFFKGLNTLADVQLNGVRANTRYYKWATKYLENKIDKAEKYLTKGREARKFQEKIGRPISLTSGKDLGILFYEILGKEKKYTNDKKENYCTDKKTLGELNLPFVDKLIEKRQYEKALGTYLAQFKREVVRGKIYPFYDLHIPVSFRSSSSNPNFQNLPKRVPEIMALVRRGLVPSSGCVLCEADFSGAEVITSACVVGNTKIETINGSRTIRSIINDLKTKEVYVYGYCLEEKRIKIAKVLDGGITGKKREVWKVTLDNGKVIKATPEHKFMIRHGSKHEGKYIELRDLKPGMSLMPFRKKKKNGYYYVNLNNRNQLAEHILIGKDIFNWDVGGSYESNVVHHKDGNGFNNKIDNLELMTRKDHTSLHHKNKKTGPHTEEHKKKISKALKGVPCPQRAVKWTKEKLKNLSESMKGRIFSDEHKKKISEHKKEYWKNKQSEICRVCGKKFTTVTNTHLLHAHNLTLEEYKNEYNHKVVSVEFYGYRNVYNINVEGVKNYATSAGVIIKNSYHKDKQFIHDITEGDMHRDLATELFLFPPSMLKNDSYSDEQKALAKKIRFFSKNNWTFAQFYGDWFVSCGEELWKNVILGNLKLPEDSSITVREWLEDKGIYELGEVNDGHVTPNSFLAHCKEVEERMWYDRFPQYTQWKEDICEFYRKYGYIETYFGFRFTGLMDNKQCTNYPIQGTSFHLLLHTLTEVHKFIIDNKMKTKIVGQIHDSIIADVPEEELKFYLSNVNRIVSNLKNKFKWIIVPMEIEAEITTLKELGGNFSKFKEVDANNPIIWKP